MPSSGGEYSVREQFEETSEAESLVHLEKGRCRNASKAFRSKQTRGVTKPYRKPLKGSQGGLTRKILYTGSKK